MPLWGVVVVLDFGARLAPGGGSLGDVYPLNFIVDAFVLLLQLPQI